LDELIMASSVLELIVGVCVAAVIYHYAGYPLLLFVVAVLTQAKSDLLYLFDRRSRRCTCRSDYLPRVALLVSAYNEAAVIKAKVGNTLQIDYPSDRLECLLGLDAPSDSTPELLAQVESSRLSVHHFDHRRGKLAVLCDLVQRTSAEILVLTDANTMLDPNCVRNLVRHFADPRVGAVSGEEIRVASSGTDPGAESAYWRYESALKLLESRLNCSLGGNGAALAVRRSLFNPQKQSIVEDFQIPMEIRFKGYRVVYDPEAIAVEEIAPTFSAQFARRVRIGAGNYQTLFDHPEYLNPFRGLLSFSFFSHRILRWLIPILLVGAFLCSIPLATRLHLALPLAAQCLFYGMAGLGYWLRKQNRQTRVLAAPLYFCSMNLALLLGLIRYLSGRQALAWNATPRIATEALWNHTRGER
jgi:cellulose synthase/poly-beta-1,6-N-acetylglucosamine synthase-like glycosyltransferase